MESPLYEIAPSGLEVIETLGFTPNGGFARMALHIDRASDTCARLRFPFDRGAALQALGEAVAERPARVRLTVNALGKVAVTAVYFTAHSGVWIVGISEQRVVSNDPWLGVKTTERKLYNRVRGALPKGVNEVIFLNAKDQVCEGTITNIFVKLGGVLVTPPLACGLLPGVLRQELLDSGDAVEGMLGFDDLTGGFYVGNSLRGLIEARLV